ncbi:MAG: amidohydrolase family protein [archaeon]
MNKLDDFVDIGVAEGKVKSVQSGLERRGADKIIDLQGKIAIPGVIDPHMHAGTTGYRMMAKAGVVTAVDFAASPEEVCTNMKAYGSGMNIATITSIRAYGTATGTELARKDAVEITKRALQSGALGIKIAGGHNPFTPDTTRMIIDVVNEERGYVGYHVGSTATGSDLNGLKEAVELADKNHLHVAHVNSYLRGLIHNPIAESLEGLIALKGRRNLVHESYLAIINGTGGKCIDGIPDSHVTRNCLRLGKYSQNQEGLEKAIQDGFANVQIEMGGESVLISGQEGVKYWKEAKTDAGISFPVNVPQSTFLCATSKDEKGEFIVDAISTDGGYIPRNIAVRSGLALVRYAALTLDEFVRKVSVVPAKMFGMTSKGHLGVGTDADVTVLDLAAGEPIMSFSKGHAIMIDGVVIGKQGTIITTVRGHKAVKAAGLDCDVVDLEESTFYKK